MMGIHNPKYKNMDTINIISSKRSWEYVSTTWIHLYKRQTQAKLTSLSGHPGEPGRRSWRKDAQGRDSGCRVCFVSWARRKKHRCIQLWKLVCYQKWGPAHRSKANKEARLVERKVCFNLEAGNWGGEVRAEFCPKADTLPNPTLTIGGKSFYRRREGAPCRTSTGSSDRHLETGHRWSDQRPLDGFQYSESSVPGSVCSHFVEASSRNCGSLCHGYSLVIV